MNRLHRWYCKSEHWSQTVRNEILPWALEGVELGQAVLEVGPGPGVTTDRLRLRTKHLECLEIDAAMVCSLQHRFSTVNVSVRRGDATAMPYEDGRFTSVVSFTMLHHIASPELQDRFLREAYRVLKPGGFFAGVDSLPSFLLTVFHIRDTLTLVAPDTLAQRLTAAGFVDVHVDIGSGRFRFSARHSSYPATEAPEHSFAVIGSR